MSLNLILQRYSDNGNSTQGLLFNRENSKMDFLSYALEDEHRAVKIKGETCIPAGLYEVKFRQVLSDKTKAYRGMYNWFHWHLHLQDVPGFQYVYIHIGNDEKDTDGCILVQDSANNNQVKDGFNGSSKPAFKRLYENVTEEINNGNKVFIRVKDINELL